MKAKKFGRKTRASLFSLGALVRVNCVPLRFLLLSQSLTFLLRVILPGVGNALRCCCEFMDDSL